MSYRIQWRVYNSHLKTPAPGDVFFEEGHDVYTASAKVKDLMQADICWLHVEDTSKDFKGRTGSFKRPEPKPAKQ